MNQTQTAPKRFNELGIKAPEPTSFIGDKIPIKKIIGKQITVHKFKIVPSKFNGNRLDMQISFNDDMRVIFTSTSGLRDTIELIPKDAFPFSTVIQEENDRYQFT